MARDSQQRRDALRRFMDSRGLKAKTWAKLAGVAASLLGNYFNGRSESLTETTLRKLARQQNVTISEMFGEKQPPRLGHDIIAVKSLQVTAAMGGGVEISEEPAGEPFYFPKSYLERITRGKLARLRVIGLTGDSMEPTLQDGDIALIDANSTDPAHAPGIYCIWTVTGTSVKRVSALPGAPPTFRIQSDNERYQIDNLAAVDLTVIGRVIWRGGTV